MDTESGHDLVVETVLGIVWCVRVPGSDLGHEEGGKWIVSCRTQLNVIVIEYELIKYGRHGWTRWDMDMIDLWMSRND